MTGPGLRVVVTPVLPQQPTPGEQARRIVRHGMADVLAWLGEPVGPKPDDLTHAAVAGGVLFVSRQLHRQLEATGRPVTLAGAIAGPPP